MKTKPKRIRALRSFINADNSVYSRSWAGATEPCYILRQSDIRALVEQMEDAWLRKCCKICNMRPRAFSRDREMRVTGLLHALKDAGMTPGKARAK